MADERISQLVERVDIAATDVLPIVSSGALTTKKVTIETIEGYMQDNLALGVPYTGATQGVDLNVQTLAAGRTTITSSGNSDTFIVIHSSGSGKGISITKGGNGEGLYINKTSGSGNAATIVGSLEATSLIRTGGTSSQFLKANGAVDSNQYTQFLDLNLIGSSDQKYQKPAVDYKFADAVNNYIQNTGSLQPGVLESTKFGRRISNTIGSTTIGVYSFLENFVVNTTDEFKVELFCKVNSFSSTPSFGMAYGTLDAIANVFGFSYRISDGQIFRTAGTVVSLVRAADPAFVGVAGDILSLELTFSGGLYTGRISKNGTYSPSFSVLSFTPTGRLLYTRRAGTLDSEIKLSRILVDPDIAEIPTLVDNVDQINSALSELIEIEKFADLNPSGYTFSILSGSLTLASTTKVSTGLNVVTTGADSGAASLLMSDVVWPDNTTIKVSFAVNSISNLPVLGVGFGLNTSVYTLFGYRSNGALTTLINGTIANPRAAGVAPTFTAGDLIDVYFKKNQSANNVQVITAKNGVLDTLSYTFSVDNFTNNYLFMRGAANSVVSYLYQKELDPFGSGSSPSSSSSEIYYVSTTGSDSNPGTSSLPFLTINKALTLHDKNTEVVILEGDYRETLNFGGITQGRLRLVARKNTVTRVLGSSKLTFTKTSGYTNIYQAPYAANLASRRLIYEDGNSSLSILNAERHSLQKGVINRLPFTHLVEKTFVTSLAITLTQLDLEPSKFYYDEAADIIYIHATGSTNPITNGFSYEVPSRVLTQRPSSTSTAQIEIENLAFFYSNSTGLNVGTSGTNIRRNVRVIGCDDDGIVDDANFVIAWNDEIADARDGVNGHFNTIPNWDTKPVRFGRGLHVYYGQWSHDNTDDGNSHHERGEVQTYGCLFEYNKKSGIAPSNSCQWTDHNSVMRKNKGNASFGEGVEVINSLIGADTSFGVVFTGFGTICEGNRIGFNSRSAANNRIILYDAVSRNNDDAEYRAEIGSIIANNCKVTNVDPLKFKVTASGGVITVINDITLL